MEAPNKPRILEKKARETVELSKNNSTIIIGTGVLSYNTDIERIVKLREFVFEASEDSND